MAHAIATVPTHASIGDLLISMSHAREGRVKWIAFLIAVAIHGVVLTIDFPEIRRAIQPRRERTFIVVRKYVPPPPAVERPQVARQQRLTRRVPIPDPTPEEPEPIREPEPEFVAPPLPPDVEVLIGVPEPPPRPPVSAPLVPGVGDVTLPVLIPETRIQPEYPELARIARIEGNVVLQAVIHSDGTVGDLVVLRCTRASFGFEKAAIEAVQQWRYRPAMSGGRPVDVYFTVFVEFTLF
jgi:protein TonB